jgi:hypothetical protein
MIETLLKDAKLKIADHLKSKYQLDDTTIDELYRQSKTSLTDSAKSLVFKGKAKDMADLFLRNDTEASKDVLTKIKEKLLDDLSKNNPNASINYTQICDELMGLMLVDIQTFVNEKAPTKDLKGILKILGLEGFAMFIK